LAKADVDQGTLLLATVHDVEPWQPQIVHLQEKKVIPVECEDGVRVILIQEQQIT
jgi:hypothetical protein